MQKNSSKQTNKKTSHKRNLQFYGIGQHPEAKAEREREEAEKIPPMLTPQEKAAKYLPGGSASLERPPNLQKCESVSEFQVPKGTLYDLFFGTVPSSGIEDLPFIPEPEVSFVSPPPKLYSQFYLDVGFDPSYVPPTWGKWEFAPVGCQAKHFRGDPQVMSRTRLRVHRPCPFRPIKLKVNGTVCSILTDSESVSNPESFRNRRRRRWFRVVVLNQLMQKRLFKPMESHLKSVIWLRSYLQDLKSQAPPPVCTDTFQPVLRELLKVRPRSAPHRVTFPISEPIRFTFSLRRS